jgi:hypothetical protein
MQINGKDPSEWNMKIGNWEPENPLLKLIIGILVSVFAIGLVVLILFGVIGPVLGIVLVITIVAIIGSLGLSLLGLLIPFAVLIAPILLIIWFISLLI